MGPEGPVGSPLRSASSLCRGLKIINGKAMNKYAYQSRRNGRTQRAEKATKSGYFQAWQQAELFAAFIPKRKKRKG